FSHLRMHNGGVEISRSLRAQNQVPRGVLVRFRHGAPTFFRSCFSCEKRPWTSRRAKSPRDFQTHLFSFRLSPPRTLACLSTHENVDPPWPEGRGRSFTPACRML